MLCKPEINNTIETAAKVVIVPILSTDVVMKLTRPSASPISSNISPNVEVTCSPPVVANLSPPDISEPARSFEVSAAATPDYTITGKNITERAKPRPNNFVLSTLAIKNAKITTVITLISISPSEEISCVLKSMFLPKTLI